MQTHDHAAHRMPPATAAETSRRSRWVFGGFALLAVLLLGFEHRMHLSGLIAPYLILLACPLMHLFMHGGHGHGGGDGRSNDGTGK